MNLDDLMAYLRSLPMPADVEEWMQPDATGNPHNGLSIDYQHGVRDVLTALGVLDADSKCTSPMAYYFVQSLLTATKDHSFNAAAWSGRSSQECAGTGAKIVHAIEEHRLSCTPNPTPLRTVAAVMSVIKARRGQEDVYLMQFDDKAEQFQPIGGKREFTDADNLSALLRELSEELELNTLVLGRDLQVQTIQEHIISDTVSATVHVLTRYTNSFYHLTDVRFPVHIDHLTRWISAAELAARKTKDGYRVTAVYDEFIPGKLDTLGYSLPKPLE